MWKKLSTLDPGYSVQIEKVTVNVKPRQLTSNWTVETLQDISNKFWGLDDLDK